MYQALQRYLYNSLFIDLDIDIVFHTAGVFTPFFRRPKPKLHRYPATLNTAKIWIKNIVECWNIIIFITAI
jgi:hypothetical protein